MICLRGAAHAVPPASNFERDSVVSKMMKSISFVALAAACAAPVLATAGVRVTGTRFVYPGNEKEIVVELSNDGKNPALVQTWLDAGKADMQLGADKLPFVVLPPLARVEAGKGQSIRISYVGGALPQDRESVFWINVLEVPPKVKDGDGKNFMQVALRTRMKMFYRPKGLQGSVEDSAQAMRWSVVPAGAGYALRATNDSAYDVTYTGLTLNAGGTHYDNKQGGMVAPHGSLDFPLDGLHGPVASGQVEATWLNDFGTGAKHAYALKP